MSNFTDAELLAYLEDALPDEKAVDLEKQLRSHEHPDHKNLQDRLKALMLIGDSGSHTIGEIWKRCRVSCPSREDLERYILEAMSDEESQFVDLHLNVIQCDICRSNLDDLLLSRSQANQAATTKRRSKYFQSSVGRLKKN